ncbi:MAG: xylulokinase [Brevefilum sp.]|nr:xylulokinase [Brevefilum sp.]
MYFLGIDVSTTATKALLMDRTGVVVGVGVAQYGFETPQPLWSEQHPNLWWAGTQNAIHAALQEASINPDEIASVGLTGQMHGLVLLDQSGRVLRKAILWNDQRTQPQCDEIHHLIGRKRFIQTTGNLALTGFTAPKILWVRENEPELYAQIAHILLPKDYVRLHLTGVYAMDKADGAGTVLMDIRERLWSDTLLEALNIPPEWLPPLFEGTQITGWITSEAAKVTGLRPGTPVIAGGGDQSAQAVGVGAVNSGIAALTLGTSGVIFTSTDQPFIEPEGRLHAFCHAVPGKWHLMGVMLSAAGSLRWYRDQFSPDLSYENLLKPAVDIAAGSEGLLFLPYLTGERTPHPDPLARGGFIGLTVRHGAAHCTRAVLEGVAFGLKDSFELLKASGVESIQQVRVSGGGAKSPLWRQILANVLDAELVTVNTTEGAAYGAAILAGVGVEHWNSVEGACESLIKITDSVTPHRAQVGTYQTLYGLYCQLYPALKPIFHQLAHI